MFRINPLHSNGGRIFIYSFEKTRGSSTFQIERIILCRGLYYADYVSRRIRYPYRVIRG